MSRCFPYPPPGYARKVARTEAALIESIKLQSERRESRTERKKEKSKHKKEKSKDKKHKSKEHKEKSSRSRDLSDQKRKRAKENLLKETKVEAEQLEKSGLTEEHGQPVWPQSPGYLSDGSQINHKRKREASLQPKEGCKPGKIIRIKLGSLSQQEDSSVGSQQTCSTSGRDNSNSLDQKRDENSCGPPIQQKPRIKIADTVVAVKDSISKPCLTIADTVIAVKASISKPKIKDPPSHVVKDVGTHQCNVASVSLPPRTRSPAESAYEALFEKWMPPPLQLEQQTDDEEWLFGSRKQDGQTTTKIDNKTFNHVPSCRSSSLRPRGQYLPDADVYSLPYTIPF